MHINCSSLSLTWFSRLTLTSSDWSFTHWVSAQLLRRSRSRCLRLSVLSRLLLLLLLLLCIRCFSVVVALHVVVVVVDVVFIVLQRFYRLWFLIHMISFCHIIKFTIVKHKNSFKFICTCTIYMCSYVCIVDL